MTVRIALLLVVVGVCLTAAPAPAPFAAGTVVAAPIVLDPPLSVGPVTNADFARLAETDPVGMLAAAIRRYRADVRGYTAELHKQERVGGRLHPPEVIRLAVRESPYSVRMVWQSGARKVLGFTVEGVLFVAGQNHGKIKVWRPDALFLKHADVPTSDGTARSTSRYPITEAGVGQAVERTYRAWSAAADAEQLKWEYLGTRPVTEVGGRVCHVLRRTCPTPELDPFLVGEPAPDPASRPSEAFSTVTVMLDAETWLQVGSELRRADGELVGSYFFRDVTINPPFTAESFTTGALRLQ